MNHPNPSEEQVSPSVDEHRRNFIGTSATLAGMAIAPGVMVYGLAHSKPNDEAVTNKVRWGMLIDTSKCADGCTDCVHF